MENAINMAAEDTASTYEQQQQRFFELAERLEQIDDERVKVLQELDVVMKNLGLDTYHQDPDTGLVYKIEKPKGTYTYFKDIDYKRTAKPGERGGTVLSKKEAEERGFTILR